MFGSIFALIVLCAVVAAYVYTQYRKAQDQLSYDYSAIVVDVPDYQPVIRNGRGQFAKGSTPIAPRGEGGKFVKRSTAAA